MTAAPSAKKNKYRDTALELKDELQKKLEDEGRTDLAEKLANCGSPVHLVCTCCGQRKTAEAHCSRRWCPACAWGIHHERMRKYSAAIEAFQWPLFVTLTQPNSATVDSVTEIRKAWSRMRRRRLIANRVRGGIVAVEITNKGQGWHPHLHAVLDCEWLALHVPPPRKTDSARIIREKCDYARAELSATWADVIGEPKSIVLAARAARGAAASYALKYATKAAELIECESEIGPLIDVMEKSRLLTTFGSLYGRKDLIEEEKVPMPCSSCGEIKTMMPEDLAFRFFGRDNIKLQRSYYEKPA